MDELRLASRLCSRLCHDLVGSIGAINNGLELLDGDQDKETRREAMELIQFAARNLRDKVQYFRVAFGLPGAGAIELDLRRSRELAVNLYAEGKIQLAWPDDQLIPTLLPEEHKLLLNLLWLAGDALARGGELQVAFASDAHHFTISVVARGRGVKLCDDLRNALEGRTPVDEIDATAAQAHLTGLPAKHVGATIPR
jgi:histidine phosphotransferase ChpT